MILQKIFNLIKAFTKHLRHKSEYPAKPKWFDWVYAALSAWFIVGIYVDGRAHHQLDSVLETFFTPWHGILYSGFIALAILLIVTAWRNQSQGFALRYSLPQGYGFAFIGVSVFLLSGVGDMLWHISFGTEVGIEALLSPTHLLLALGAGLVLSAPMNSLHSGENMNTGYVAQLPAIFSVAFLIAMLSFMTQFVSMVVHPWPATGQMPGSVFAGEALGISNIIIQTVIMMGVLIMLIKRWNPPAGFFTTVFVLVTAGLSAMEGMYQFIFPALLSGIAADVLFAHLRPIMNRTLAFRFFAFAAPVLLYLGYFGAIFLSFGTWWPAHLWSGGVIVAGITGWLLSYLVVEPGSREIS